MKKLIAMILASACVVACATSCGGESSATNSSSSNSSSGSVQNGVYKPATLTSNGEEIGSYKIVKSSQASECESYAAEELRDYIYEGTGVTLPIITDEATKSSNEVVIGQTNRDICKGVDYTALGEEGYTLKTNGKDLLIGANETRGVLYGVYTYLEKLGYRFYTKEVENIPSSRKVFIAKDLEETYVPRLEYRDILYEAAIGGEIATKLKINTAFCQTELKTEGKYGGSIGYVYDERGMIHTVRYLVSDNYMSTNPEYFALWNGKRVGGQWGGHCFSCEELVDVVTPVALSWIKNDPGKDRISISFNDGGVYCQCELCLDSYEKYGKSWTYVNFVNKVAKKIGEVYPNVKVEMMSYSWALLPPENTVLEDNVVVRVCAPRCHIKQHQTEWCEEIKATKARLDAWSALTDNVWLYTYRSDYFDWFSVVPNIYTMYDEVQFFTDEEKVKGIYQEGYLAKSPEFGELRTYVGAKLLWNPDMTREEYNYHIDDFLQGYYGDGWKYLREYIKYNEEVGSENAIKLEEEGADLGSEGTIYMYRGADECFFGVTLDDYSIFEKWNQWWDKAEEMADYEQLERIKVSRIAPTFFELSYTMDYRMLRVSSEEQDELMARNKALYETIIKNNVLQKRENYYIRTDVMYFSQSPKTWVYKK